MLDITFDKEIQSIEITTDSYDRSWQRICRVVNEEVQESYMVSAKKIRLPVWTFISCRKSIGYALKKAGTEISLDNNIKSILQNASKRENEYRYIESNLPIDKEILHAKLNRVGFKRQLTDHQIRNVSKLAALPAGATFSVPGAGKTTEALAYYYYKKEEDSKLLVVAPKNAFASWEEQVILCLNNPPKVTRLVGGNEVIFNLLKLDPTVMLITYSQLMIVRDMIATNIFRIPFFMFLDESHRIKKGYEGAWGRAVLSLSHLPDAKLIMSGTPLPNSIDDLISQFEFLYPEIQIQNDSIEKLVQPIYVRTTKKELRLPAVNRKLIPIQMNQKQQHLYELMRSETARRIEVLRSKKRIQLRAFGKSVMRLLQMASNPALLAREEINYPSELSEVLTEGDSPKIEYVCQRARQLAREGKKVIIWSIFVQNVETIARRLSDLGADYIHGGVDAGSDEEEDTRERKIKRFHEDDSAYVLVANPAACAEGISLHTVCHNAIYVDRSYNAAQYLQSEDRIHRLGLPPDTITEIEILYCTDSIDESVQRRLTTKVQRMADVLNDPSLNISPGTTDLDEDGIDQGDITDLISHLTGN